MWFTSGAARHAALRNKHGRSYESVLGSSGPETGSGFVPKTVVENDEG